MHRLHIQLHELAHLLCGHKNEVLADEQIAILLRQDAQALAANPCLRSTYTDETEQEAETLAGLIYEQMTRQQRLEQWRTVGYVQAGMAAYWRLVEGNHGCLG